MKNGRENKPANGFSIIELLIAMTIMLVVLSLVSTLFSKSLGTRQRESSRVDAQTAAQAALNVMSREIANSGYGLITNGIVIADSNSQQLRILSNTTNSNAAVTDPDEDITYFYDTNTKSILRQDANAGGAGSPQTSIIINRISSVDFLYFNYSGASSTATQSTSPTPTTCRVRVTITVNLEDVQGQTKDQKVKLISDVTMRNADYMLQQY